MRVAAIAYFIADSWNSVPSKPLVGACPIALGVTATTSVVAESACHTFAKFDYVLLDYEALERVA